MKNTNLNPNNLENDSPYYKLKCEYNQLKFDSTIQQNSQSKAICDLVTIYNNLDLKYKELLKSNECLNNLYNDMLTKNDSLNKQVEHWKFQHDVEWGKVKLYQHKYKDYLTYEFDNKLNNRDIT